MPSIAFGPVPSRRLGRSVGINNIPPKMCSYSCRYCQVGRTRRLLVDRRQFISPEDIARETGLLVQRARHAGEHIDYLSFVPDGEPTLDCRLGETIDSLRPLGIPIAVISNGSLLWKDEVRRELQKADWVSLKVDAVDERTWRRLDRPHRALRLEAVMEGMLAFREAFGGQLVTETMLAAGENDGEQSSTSTALFLARLRPDRAFLSIPTRPPAERAVTPPSEEVVRWTLAIFRGLVADVECLTASEGNSFSCTGEPAEALLGITAVHPMRRGAVQEFLLRAHSPWSLVEGLLQSGELVESRYEGETFYRRAFPAGAGRQQHG